MTTTIYAVNATTLAPSQYSLTALDAVVHDNELPRDEIRRYRHVIQPLADLAPNECDPLSGRRFSEISEALVSDDVQLWQIDSAWLQLA